MNTTVSNPPPPTPTSASTPTQIRPVGSSSNSMLQRSNAAADGERFASAMSSQRQRVEADNSPEDTGPPENSAEQSESQFRSPTRTESKPESDSGEDSNDSSEPENTDGSASWSASLVNPAGLTTGIVAGSGMLVSVAGGEASMQGALSASNVATLLESLQARSAAAGNAMTFRLVDSGYGLTSMQLARHANGAWQIQLSAERSSRDNLKRLLDELESGLEARGHRIDRIVLLDGSAHDR